MAQDEYKWVENKSLVILETFCRLRGVYILSLVSMLASF